MRYDLPETVTLDGVDYQIRSDFRVALDIFEILNDRELLPRERISLVLMWFYPDFRQMPTGLYQKAIEMCFWFLSGGEPARPGPRLMDWEQDFPYIIAPVNRVVGREVRQEPYFHWWSFLGAYREIGECLFSQIVQIRTALASGKKLDDGQRRWYAANRELVDLRQPATQKEKELLKIWGGACENTEI